ncbi:DnaD/phage-associated family protein [Virgibacillus litoralis]|uniref:DnaD/phage-associated family protein n=1 Tax=Virgibacillus litoralis TaxID=578221 RepID=A0ABS4HHZ9_9BACI|nr:DnaD/phage-associated family protein [Virgibacillus litoralis]
MINPFVVDALLNWVNDVGEDLVLDAMKRALERGKGNLGYVKGILQAWVKKGITSVETAKAEEVEFKNERMQKQKQKQYRNYEKPNEVVPDWFTEHNEKTSRQQRRRE